MKTQREEEGIEALLGVLWSRDTGDEAQELRLLRKYSSLSWNPFEFIVHIFSLWKLGLLYPRQILNSQCHWRWHGTSGMLALFFFYICFSLLFWGRISPTCPRVLWMRGLYVQGWPFLLNYRVLKHPHLFPSILFYFPPPSTLTC